MPVTMCPTSVQQRCGDELEHEVSPCAGRSAVLRCGGGRWRGLRGWRGWRGWRRGEHGCYGWRDSRCQSRRTPVRAPRLHDEERWHDDNTPRARWHAHWLAAADVQSTAGHLGRTSPGPTSSPRTQYSRSTTPRRKGVRLIQAAGTRRGGTDAARPARGGATGRFALDVDKNGGRAERAAPHIRKCG